MKKSRIVSIILVMIVSFAIILLSSETFAANNVIDITNTITGNNISNNAANNIINETENNTVGNNTTNNTINNTTNNTVLTTNNTSNYNNSSLPDTGIESSIPAIIFVLVLGISAVYAYNKTQYYKNV